MRHTSSRNSISTNSHVKSHTSAGRAVKAMSYLFEGLSASDTSSIQVFCYLLYVLSPRYSPPYTLLYRPSGRCSLEMVYMPLQLLPVLLLHVPTWFLDAGEHSH